MSDLFSTIFESNIDVKKTSKESEKISYSEAYKIFVDWLNDKNDNIELTQEVLAAIPENTLITILHSNIHFTKLSNEFLNNIIESMQYIKSNKLEISKFIKHVYNVYCMSTTAIKPIYRRFDKKSKSYIGLKSYELDILNYNESNPEIYETQYKTTKKLKNKKITLSSIKKEFENIKSSSSLCFKCPLRNGGLVLFDSNVKSEIKNVDVLFVGEAPGKDEVEEGKPFVGKSGKKLRMFINRHFNDVSWFISNVCLCRPQDNRTPTIEEIGNCAPNLDRIIETVKPKIIIALGKTSMIRFNIDTSNGIMKLRKSTNTYVTGNGEKYTVFPTVHPSYIIRGNKEYIYEEDFAFFRKVLDGMKTEEIKSKMSNHMDIHSIKFDDDFYKKNYMVDIQLDTSRKNIIYVLKDRETLKTYRLKFKGSENRYCYYSPIQDDLYIKPVSDVILKHGFVDKNVEGTFYENGLHQDIRHSVDYYHIMEKLKLDNSFELSKMYVDIEVATKNKEFPLVSLTKYPISIISFNIDNKIKKTFVNLSKHKNINDNILKSEINGYEVTYFSNETKMIKEFINYTNQVDIITAWNVSFDMGYIINRYQNKLKRKYKSPANAEVHVDDSKNEIRIPGLIVFDLLEGYKDITAHKGQKPSYKLDYISQIELGEKKLEKGSDFGEIFFKDIERAIKYNIDDVEKIYKLDNKLDIINFFKELKNSSAVPFNYIFQTTKVVECNILKFLKSKNLVFRDNYGHIDSNVRKIGAYVKTPKPGLFKNVYVVDFKSLYPSIIRTFNIGIDTFEAKFNNLWNDVKDFINGVDRPYEITINPAKIDKKTETMNLDEIKEFMSDKILTPYGSFFSKHEKHASINYEILTFLDKKRTEHRKLQKEAKTETEKQNENNKQLSFKRLSNSNYGYYGYEGSPIFNVDIANSITVSGQYLIKISSLYSKILKSKDLNNIDIVNLTNEIFDKYWMKEFIDKDSKKLDVEMMDIELNDTLYTDTDSIYKLIIEDENESTPEKVKEKGDKIFDTINNIVYPKIIGKIFNFSPSKNHLILEYENIATKAYWPSKKKKRYTYIDIDNHVSIKGLETQRSDYPEFTRENLKHLIDIILYTNNPKEMITKLETHVKSTMDTMLNMVKNYDTKIIKTVTYGTQEYKKDPAHIIGMKLWNIINDREDFRPGTRGYQYLITLNMHALDQNKKEKIYKMKSDLGYKKDISNIVIPEDYTQEEIKDFFEKYKSESLLTDDSIIKVDVERTMDFIWYTRVINLLSGIADFSYLFYGNKQKQKNIETISNEKFNVLNF